jgi:hypothetical protein
MDVVVVAVPLIERSRSDDAQENDDEKLGQETLLLCWICSDWIPFVYTSYGSRLKHERMNMEELTS